jgi:hypothetical protein
MTTSFTRAAAAFALILAFAPACGDDGAPDRDSGSSTSSGPGVGVGGAGPEIDPAACAPPAIWKRTDALLADVARALELDDPCTELGAAPCDLVHRSTLGESQPFRRAQYKRPESPFATTPLAFERVVLEACGRRVDADRAGDPRVFTALDLEATAVDPASDAMRATVTELFQRFHGRTPGDPEIAAIAGLATADDGAPRPASEVAVLACFAVGSSAELLFY